MFIYCHIVLVMYCFESRQVYQSKLSFSFTPEINVQAHLMRTVLIRSRLINGIKYISAFPEKPLKYEVSVLHAVAIVHAIVTLLEMILAIYALF